MTPPDPTSPDELAALYFAGALPPTEAEDFEARWADGWPDAEESIRGGQDAVRALLAGVTPAVPPPALKSELLTRLDTQDGMVFQFAADGGFRPSRYPGVAVRVLHTDHARRQFTCLMRLDPGAVLPGHPHDGPEECIVLDGEVIVGNVRLGRGDYQRVEAGTEHGEQWSETGALVFVTAPLALLEDDEPIDPSRRLCP